MRVEVIPALPEHAAALAPRLRRADADEVWAAAHETPADALRLSLSLSLRAWAGLVDGDLVCLWGVCPRSLLAGEGVPWLLGAEGLERAAVPFLRRSRPAVAEMLALFPRLENYVDARNATSIRWLRWLGFTIAPAAPWGAESRPFHRFTLTRA